MTQTANRSEQDLRTAVEKAIRSPLGDQADHVGVAVVGGEVTLTGRVHTDLQRKAACVAASYVAGVETIANNITAVDPSTAGH